MQRDLLAAYSALDHGTTAELSSEQVDGAFRRFLARLSVLLYLHGARVPGQFLEALQTAHNDAIDPVELTASVLESGRTVGVAPTTFSELQQELVHFSRIVDVGTLGLNDSDAHRAVRRLRNSHRLPDSLKVLSELIIVARSRMAHRGVALPAPWLRPLAVTERELDAQTSLWIPAENDYVLIVISPRRRTRKEAAYLSVSLLSYLTPAEAVLAVWAHTTSIRRRTWLDVALIAVGTDRSTSVVLWSLPSGDITQATEEPITWCQNNLPELHLLDSPETTQWITAHGLTVTANQEYDQVRLRVAGPERTVYSTVLAPPATGETVSVEDIAARADRLIQGYDGPEIASIECGHIHLDRELDIDQEVGLILGARAVTILKRRQTTPPTLTPMMDDDHVQVKLRPADYRDFLNGRFYKDPMHLIPESSPIIRSIVCAMWARVQHLGLTGRCRKRGQNLFLELGSGNHCELFEDFSGETITGCVLFESALLVYRTAPARFDEYFWARFTQANNVHEKASHILDRAGPHDAKIDLLQTFYSTFSDVTNPHDPDSEIVALVDDVIETARPGVAHLNVLEDYYEIQQGKVRALIELLELPMRLLTVHFNAQTGRVILDG